MKSEPEGWEGHAVPFPTDDRDYASAHEKALQRDLERVYWKLRDLGWDMVDTCPANEKFLAMTAFGVKVCRHEGGRFWADYRGFVVPIIPFAWRPMPASI